MVPAITSGRSFRASLVLSWLAVGVAACAGQGDIDRTQPDAIDKALVQFYGYRFRMLYTQGRQCRVTPIPNWSTTA